MTDHSGNQDKVAEPMQPQLCVKCCEFFGNAANYNMCSKCYKDFCSHKESTETPKEVKALPIRNALSMGASSTPETSAPAVLATPPPQQMQIQQQQAEKPAAPQACSPCATPESCSCKPAVEVAAVASAGQQPPQKHKNRCYKCKKKIGLTGFKCRCGYIFCSEHRYSDKHECTFDYKLAGRENIAKANPKVVASKINKI